MPGTSWPTFQPSAAISGRLRSISAVTVKRSSMIGAGPFSRASSRPISQPAIAISRDTRSVKSQLSFEPYFMRSMVIVEPRPRKPIPWRRLRRISSRCSCSGRPLTSTTLSSMRVNTRTTSRYSSQSNVARSVNGLRTNLVRLIEPNRQAP